MAEYLSPAVFIEEVPSGIKPIEGVGTSTAAFVGHAERGPIGEPVKLTNFAQFLARFGGFIDNGYLAYAVKSFFDEGGSTCYVVRTVHYEGGDSTATASSVTFGSSARNGLSDSNVDVADGFEEFRFDGSTSDVAFLVGYVAATDSSPGQLTLEQVGSSSSQTVSLTPFDIAEGTPEEVVFSTFGATVVLNSEFDKDAAVAIDQASYTQVGTGNIDQTTIAIAEVVGEISSITSSELIITSSPDNPGEIHVNTSTGGFSGVFDGSAIDVPQTLSLRHGDDNQLDITLTVTVAFEGDETSSTINLDSLANLVLAGGRLLGISAESEGSWGDDISVVVTHPDDSNVLDRFGLIVTYPGFEDETHRNLSMDRLDDRYVETIIARDSRYIAVTFAATAAARPEATATAVPLTGGVDGLTSLNANDYGDPDRRTGLYAFDAVDAINLVAVPDAVNRDVHVGGMAYCAGRGDCVYLADCQPEVTSSDAVLNYKLAQGLYVGGNAFGSKYGALYAPWILVYDPRTKGRIPIPPSGAVAGRLAATDVARGVHKAAAGVEDGRLRSVLGLAFEFTAADQEALNPKGINVLRRFSGFGNLIWGARTVSADPEWRYLNVRRLFLFLEESIEESTSWVVFEPNDRTLWKRIERNVKAFLKRQWLRGALVGNTADQAYYVKCDEETNPPESIDLGRVITEVGVAPSKPAEFVIFRIAQFAGGSEVSE